MKSHGYKTGRAMKIVAALYVLAMFSGAAAAADQPEIFVPLGHSGSFITMDISPDGKYAISGSHDATIKLWNIPLKKEVRTIKLEGEVRSVQFSGDGKHVLTGDARGNLTIWDFDRWIILKKFKHYSENVTNFQWSDKGPSAISSGGRLTYWDISSNKKIFEYRNPAENSGNQTFSILSKNSKQIAIGYHLFLEKGDGSRMDILDVSTKKIIRRSPIIKGDTLTGMKWLQNDRDIAAVFRHDGQGSEGGSLKVWNTANGEIKKSITYEKDPPWGVDCSADGKYCAVGTYGKVFLYDAETWNQMTAFEGSAPVSFSKDSDFLFYVNYRPLVSGGTQEAIHVKHLATGAVDYIAPFLNIESSKFAVYTDNDKIFAVGHKALSWDVPSGIPHSPVNVSFEAVSKGQKYGVESYSEKGAWKGTRLWDIRNNRLVHDWPMKDREYVYNHQFSPDGKYIIASHYDPHEIYAFNLQDFSIRKFKQPCEGSIQNLGFFPDGKRALSIEWVDKEGSGAKLSIWDVDQGNILKEFYYFSLTSAFAVSEDGRHILLGSNFPDSKGGLKYGFILQDAVTGKKLKTFTGHGDQVSALTFYSKNTIASADAQGEIKIWDVATGKAVKTLAGRATWIRSLTFSPDGKKLLYTSADKTIRLCDIATGKQIAQFISFFDGEWIVITPEGYFNASPNGAKYINVRIGNQVYSIENFYEAFFNPVYVASVLQGKKVESAADIRKGFLTPPDVRIVSPAPGQEFSADTLTVSVAAKDTGGGIDEIRLYHNGKVVGGDARAVKLVSRGDESFQEYKVLLVDGRNTFRAVGFSRDRTESNPYELVVGLAAPSKDVSLHVLAVGINRYRNPALNLNYAEPDAKGIADFFRREGQKLFKKVDVIEIFNEQATRENIAAKLSQMQNTHPQDAVLIYLAGHGESLSDKWYFIPHELTHPEREDDVKSKGISSDELSRHIKNIRAQKTLVLIDACKSGAVLVAFRGFEDRKALSQLSRSTGVHVIAASTKDQFAAEVKDLGHGVFTYTLLEGLRGKAAGAGKTVTVLKLKAYLDEQLPEITKKYRQEAQYPVGDNKGMDFPLATVN
jgi:WD40 repeat protein